MDRRCSLELPANSERGFDGAFDRLAEMNASGVVFVTVVGLLCGIGSLLVAERLAELEELATGAHRHSW